MHNIAGYRTTQVALLLCVCVTMSQSAHALSPMPAPEPKPVTFSAEQEQQIGEIALRYLQAHPLALAHVLAQAPQPLPAGHAGTAATVQAARPVAAERTNVKPAAQTPRHAESPGDSAVGAPCVPCPGNAR